MERDGEPLKIAMIGHKRVPSREGGIEVVVDRLAVRMAARGHQVDIYNRNCLEPKLKAYRGARIIEIPTVKNAKLNALVYSFFATVRALFGKYDVLHYHAEGPCAMIPLAKLFRKRVVATIHGLDWQRAKWGGFATRYLKFGERMAAKHADELIVLSRNMQEYFQTTYRRATHLIANGIDAVEPKAPEIIAEKYGLDVHSYILYLARLTPEKGLDYLLDAYAALDTDKPLIIAGRCEPSTEYIESVKAKAAKDPRVRLIGFVEGDELRELYSNCFVYVLPSDVEGMPISLLEAIGFRARCVISDIPENTEVAGSYAHPFAHGSAQALHDVLAALLAQEPLYASNFRSDRTPEGVERTVAEIVARHCWDTIADETLALYVPHSSGSKSSAHVRS